MLRKCVMCLLWTAILSCAIAALATPYLRWRTIQEPARAHFVDRWTRAFARCHTIDEMIVKANTEPYSFYEARYFRDGGRLFVFTHNPCSGALGDRWDAAVLCDTNGRISITVHHFGEDESMHRALVREDYVTLQEFYADPPWRLARVHSPRFVPARDDWQIVPIISRR